MSAIDQAMFWASYPRIKKAALEVAYDNGMINRGESEEQFLERAMGALCADGVPVMDVIRLEMFLNLCSDDDLVKLCTGDQVEIAVIEVFAPQSLVEPTQKVTRLLNDIFEC